MWFEHVNSKEFTFAMWRLWIWDFVNDFVSDDLMSWSMSSMWLSHSFESSADVAVNELKFRSIQEYASAQLNSIFVFEFKLVEFHNISIFMLTLSDVLFWLMKDTSACSILILNTHLTLMHRISKIRDIVFFMFTVNWKNVYRRNIFFIIDFSSLDFILSSLKFFMNVFSRSSFWMSVQEVVFECRSKDNFRMSLREKN
jgi:hypothetical protein